MINKLRNKFIILSLSSVLIVLCIILASINYLNYSSVVKSADNVLEMLTENGGSFQTGHGMNGPGGMPPADHGGFDNDFKPYKGDRRDLINSPETPFESRYFSVTLDGEGNVLDVNTDMVASVDEETAAGYALSVRRKGNTAGFISDYRYTALEISFIGNGVDQDNTGGTMYIFLDCARSLGNFQSFLYSSIEVGVLAFIAVAVFIILLSRRIVRPVAESYDKQKRFITDAGHEIKTPLAIIEADAAVIEIESGESEWVDDIKAQTKRLADLTQDLIYLSRMEETQKSQQKRVPFSFTDISREIAKSFEARAVLDSKDYTIDIADGITMTGDDEAIGKLVSILLDNAFKYSDQGGTVSIRAEKINSKQFRLTVYNTADNISAEDVPHLFERFYRGEKSRNKETGGSGIGLSIAEAVVTAHGGKISASAGDGKSLTITATLPMQ